MPESGVVVLVTGALGDDPRQGSVRDGTEFLTDASAKVRAWARVAPRQ